MELDNQELEATRKGETRVEVEKKCKFCEAKVFVQVERVMKPILAPLTEVEQLEYELINKTGIQYVRILNNYCPMCGRKLV